MILRGTAAQEKAPSQRKSTISREQLGSGSENQCCHFKSMRPSARGFTSQSPRGKKRIIPTLKSCEHDPSPGRDLTDASSLPSWPENLLSSCLSDASQEAVSAPTRTVTPVRRSWSHSSVPGTDNPRARSTRPLWACQRSLCRTQKPSSTLTAATCTSNSGMQFCNRIQALKAGKFEVQNNPFDLLPKRSLITF